jgi:histidyl-tRNA synthetase
LRTSGLRAELEQAGRSLKGQLKQADRVGAVVTVILGDSIEVKDMQTGEQRPVDSLESAVHAVRDALEATGS